MGTALSMNALAEALGMSLPGCASIPAPYRERGQMAYATGKRICELVMQVRPSQIMTREAFENAIAVASALGLKQLPSAPDRHRPAHGRRIEPG
jgi:dihydroxy-acid dehydratase